MSKFIAMEIGTELTKILYGIDKKGELNIRDYRMIQNTEKLFNPDGELNINEIQPLLKNTLKDMGVRRADCYLTVGGQSGIVRLREMPMVRLKEMKDIVRFEAEQFLPYNADAFYIDFRINKLIEKVDGPQDEAQMSKGTEHTEAHTVEAMIVAAPKELIDDQIELVNKLKLNIKRVDYYTDAIYCYFKKYILEEEKNVLVVDLGAAGMKLTMFNGTKYFASISSELGVNALVDRYSEQNNIPKLESTNHLLNLSERSEDATSGLMYNRMERLREKLQFVSLNAKNQNTLDIDIDSKLELLYEPVAYEVGKMMEFFKTRQFGMTVDELYLIGGGTNLTQLLEFLKYYHNIDVLKVKCITPDADVPEQDYSLMVPVIGGLLKGGC